MELFGKFAENFANRHSGTLLRVVNCSTGRWCARFAFCVYAQAQWGAWGIVLLTYHQITCQTRHKIWVKITEKSAWFLFILSHAQLHVVIPCAASANDLRDISCVQHVWDVVGCIYFDPAVPDMCQRHQTNVTGGAKRPVIAFFFFFFFISGAENRKKNNCYGPSNFAQR